MTNPIPSAEELELIFYPDPRLRKKATPIGEIDDGVKGRLEAMVRILYDANGIGLAATQVGWMERACLINPSGEEGDHEVLINPEVVTEQGRASREEGCLSLPDIYASVSRPERISVRYQNLDGEIVEREAEGLEATVIQHELDHLDGILFITKVSPADRVKMKKALRALEQEYEESR